MRARPWLVPVFLMLASPAAAQLNSYYAGTQRVDGKAVPVTTQYSIDSTRVAVVFKGHNDWRMLYTAQDGRLRIVDDAGKRWFDLARDHRNAMNDMLAQMQQQLAAMPPEQRQMAQKMMGGATAGMSAPEVVHYIRTDSTRKVNDYDCRRVDVVRDGRKRGEYWGSTAKDFAISPKERAIAIEMHDAMTSAVIVSSSSGGGDTRPFEWDTSKDGWPLITRCVDGDQVTLDLHMVSFDRKPLDAGLFELPKGYAEQKLDAPPTGGGRHFR
ncbi:MAG TPA: hypothetical protein VFK69_13980 [Candidatus Eisenbacteria bacterium]|nr:hypothetical protein [Candidatus Eisenbacteria bacterium]